EELAGHNVSVVFQAEEGVLDERIQRLISMKSPMFEEATFRTRNGDLIPVLLTGDDLGRTFSGSNEIVMAGIDITELKLKNQKLRDSTRRLSLALNAAQAGVWEIDLESEEQFWDDNMASLIDLDPEEFDNSYQHFEQFIQPTYKKNLEEKILKAVDDSGVFEEEFQVKTAEGRTRWLMSRGEVVADESGSPRSILGVTLDVTERRQTQEALEEALSEKDTLLREIHHRVKNNMQVVESLLSMQRRNLDRPGVNQAFEETIRRVQTMAIVHENLYQSGNFSSVNLNKYLRNLCNNILAAHGYDERINIDLNLVDYELSLDQSVACGLIVNELLMNCLEHGFKENEDGSIMVELFASETGSLSLTVSDNGCGLDEDFNWEQSRSTGLEIVHSLAEYELDGSVTYEESEGVSVTVNFDPD
ncbi:MAG: sensor histidine kinase, partial [bacterium]